MSIMGIRLCSAQRSKNHHIGGRWRRGLLCDCLLSVAAAYMRMLCVYLCGLIEED